MELRNLIPFRRKPAAQQKGWVNTMDSGMVHTGWDEGYWQQDKKSALSNLNETVEACISTLSQTVAMCPVHLYQEEDSGEKIRLRGRNPERVILNPNSYQTRSSFFNAAIRSLYYDGNAYGVARRDSRGAISAIHLMDPRTTRAVVDPESEDIYYYATPNYKQPFRINMEEDRIFPARDVLHLRINTGIDPLHGVSPIQAAANSISANTAMVGHQASFFNNMSRSSGVLSTDAQLNREQMTQLRAAWEEQSKGLNSGGVPILSNGLKWQALSLSSQDAQLVEAYGMTVGSISRVFRVPLSLINDMNGSTFSNAEAVMRWFLASGLGFLLEHIELELDKFFDLPFTQGLNFETKALLRSDWKGRIDALGEGVLKGIYSPNEARAMEGLAPADGGDEPRVQQQVVPLTWEPPAAAPAAAPDEDEEPPAEEEPTDEEIEAALLAGIEKGMTSRG